MDAVAHFGAEHVVDEAVLSDAAEACERGRGHDRIEVMPVAPDLGSGAWNPGLDPLLQLLWRSRHNLKRSGGQRGAILAEA